MAIVSCEACGSLFHKTVKDLCPKCVHKEEEDLIKVRMFIRRNKTAPLTDVSKETDVKLELIHRFLQEGRITLSSGSTITYPCKQCSTAIHEGSLCPTCLNNLRDIQYTLTNASAKPEVEETKVKKEKRGAFHSKG